MTGARGTGHGAQGSSDPGKQGRPERTSPVPRAPSPVPRFSSVILDVDSTLSGIEGVDWLAARREPAVAQEVARLTERAMDGAIALDAVYGGRLALIKPTAAEVAELARAYGEQLAPGAGEVIARLRAAGVRVVLVSGGLREAIVPFAARLGFADADVNAVGVRFDAAGGYAGFDERSPLTTQLPGKPAVGSALALPRPVLAVGDGSTDAALRSVVDAFAAYVGFVRRDPVVRAADHVVSSFAEIESLVLSDT